MGACYSKSSASAKHLKIKAPKFRKHDLKNKGEPIDSPQSRGSEQLLQVQDNDDVMVNQTDSSALLSPSVIPDLVSDLDTQSGEHVTSSSSLCDKSVVPSDSGIESIGLVAVEEPVSAVEASSLSTRLERLSRGSCHKCGNFKLDGSALTALLSNTYCLCGPRQAGRPSVNPDCQTHGIKRDFKRSQSMPVKCGGNVENFSGSSSPLKSNLKRSDGEKKEKTLRISLENNLDKKMSNSNSMNNEEIPLTQYDSDDALEKGEQKRLSRHSLLSEILDITDSICKCDFYSNEYCVGQEKSEGIDDDGNSNNVDVDDTLESMALSGSTASNFDISNENNDVDSPSTKSASMSKFVTFAKEKNFGLDHEVNGESESQSCPISPLKRLNYPIDLRNSVSETSSGVDMQSADTSGSVLSPNLIDYQVTKNEHLMAAASYDAVDRTDDDLASLDMDSLSRVTSLSYGSIRQLLESTEDLVEPLDTVRRMTINGEDCVIIPTNTYKQMQADLTMLKEQLGCLSSLLQEVCHSAGRENDTRNRKSFSFCADQDTTLTPRKFQYRSQEFVDTLLHDQ